MESKRNSARGRKRRHSSYRPGHEMFTRSKYQFDLHRNRSGQSRSETSFSHKYKRTVRPCFQTPSKKLKSGSNQQPANDDDQVLHILIKDLRTKRIFTPKLTDEDARIGESGVEFDLVHQKENSFLWSRNEIYDNEEKENNDGGIENLDQINSIISPTVSECSPSGGNEVRENSGDSEEPLNLNISVSKLSVENRIRASSCSELADEVNEECLQATPPDAEIVQEFNRNRRNDMPSDGIDRKCNGCVGELPPSNISIRTESLSQTRFVLRPCFKRRLFKPPGSFSYKRLLPFLRGIAGDDSGVPEGCQGSKFENGLVNKPLEPTVLAISSRLLNDRKQDSESPECDTLLPIALDNPCFINEQCLELLVDGRTDNFDGDSKLCRTEKSGDDFLEVKREKDDFNDESIMITPPDAEIVDKQVVEESGSHKIECNQMDTDQDLEQPLSSIENHDCHSIYSDKGNNSSYNRKGVQDTCARLKIFRSPGSVSYKRLLPFLMDIVKDNSLKSCGSGNNDNSKFGKDSLSMTHSEGATSDGKEIPLDISNSCKLYTKQQSNNPAPLSMTVWKNPTNGSGSEKESILTSSARTPDSIISSESEKQQFQSEQAAESDRREMETSPNIAISIHGGVSTSRLESFLGEFVRLDSCQSCKDTEKVCTRCTNNAELHKADSLQLNSSYGEQLVVPSETPVSFKKGILKKNPRGCRGLCTCLNCSSFRLHAERAFEFSRNQLLDAEEVALDLIKELSYLRSVLEKSADAALLNQAKDACKKASEAEAVAKDRFAQMNDELKIHSRISCSERPNVKFANNVEEKQIHVAK